MVQLRALRADDAEAHHAGEDEQTVRWLSGGWAPVEGVRSYFEWLARNAAEGRGKRAFGVWVNGRLAGYIEFDPDVTDGLDPGDVNIAYSVHPWARGRGIAALAVRELCAFLKDQGIGCRAAIRVEPKNESSVRVAEKAGFQLVREFVSTTDKDAKGRPATLRLYRLSLG